MEPETPRFEALLTWFRSIGCKGLCAIRLAILTVEKEWGRECELTGECNHELKCDDVARRAWAPGCVATTTGPSRSAASITPTCTR